ncbi:MAG: hypothetical protein K0S68_366 [Candidatus Saccharibacteria bacterium]|jgi:hypothetical protein|nr:hypothetical protein [Candidatus Saccharibacteria bacterium]
MMLSKVIQEVDMSMVAYLVEMAKSLMLIWLSQTSATTDRFMLCKCYMV